MPDDACSLRQQGKLADRALGCQRTPALWWSMSDIWRSIEEVPGWMRRPPLERFYREFLDAVQAGVFDRKGKTRVAFLNPLLPGCLDVPWPQLRLTAERARRLLAHAATDAPAFRLDAAWHFSQHRGRWAFIEIDRTHNWLATWLDPTPFDAWRHSPLVVEALRAAVNARRNHAIAPAQYPLQPMPSIANGVTPAPKPGVHHPASTGGTDLGSAPRRHDRARRRAR
jgi:hypothetical protein